MRKEKGVATIGLALVILIAITSSSMYAAKTATVEQKVSANNLRAKQAYMVAEGGLEFGLSYLKENKNLILIDADNNGYIDNYSNIATSSVTSNGGGTYSITYTNPTTNNFSLIQVSATGINPDGSSSRTIKQMLAFNIIAPNLPPTPITAKGNVDLGGSLEINNTDTDFTIQAGGTVTLSGSANTNISSGVGSDTGGLNADVVENDAIIAGQTSSEFFGAYFESTAGVIKGSADIFYSNNVNTNYAPLLDGVEGKIIWIEQTAGTAQIGGGTIGSPTDPVIIIVNGDLAISGNIEIYGLIYVRGNWYNGGFGTPDIYGSIVVEGDFTGNGNATVTYDPALDFNLDTVGIFAKVPGSWIDI